MSEQFNKFHYKTSKAFENIAVDIFAIATNCVLCSDQWTIWLIESIGHRSVFTITHHTSTSHAVNNFGSHQSVVIDTE